MNNPLSDVVRQILTKRLQSEFFWVVAAQFLTMVGGVILVSIAARLAGPYIYGLFATALSVAAILTILIFGPISQVAMRFSPKAALEENDPIFSTIILLSLAVLALLAVLAAALCWVFALIPDLYVAGGIVFVLTALIGGQQVAAAVLNGARRRRRVAVAQMVEIVVRLAALAIAFAFLERSAFALLCAFVIGSAAGLIVLLTGWRQSFGGFWSHSVDRARLKQRFASMASYAWPFVLFGLVGVVGSHGERLILAQLAPLQDVGRYAVISQLANAPLALCLGVVNNFAYPILFGKEARGGSIYSDRGLRYYSLASLAVIGGLTIAVAIFGQPVLLLLTKEKFADSGSLMILMVLSSGIFNVGQQLVLLGLAANKSSIYIFPKLGHSIALLAGASILVPIYGLLGMAWAQLGCAIFYALAVALANYRLKQGIARKQAGSPW